jgi:hypothetical protein
MRLALVAVLMITVVSPSGLRAQELHTRSSIMLRSTLVTSSRVFDNPTAQDIVDRDHYDFVDNLLGGGLQYRLEFPDQNILFTFSVEYASRILDQTSPFLTSNQQLVQLPVKQGVRFIPAEIGVETNVPLIQNTLRLTMGGGFGVYYADRVYAINGVSMSSVTLPIGYGIHIETGFDYRIYEHIGLRAEMRFRDPEVTNESKFTSNRIQVGSYQIPVNNIPPTTKINVHGVAITLGVLFGFDWFS